MLLKYVKTGVDAQSLDSHSAGSRQGLASTKASVAASAGTGIGFLFLRVVSFLEHNRSVGPSLLHQLYILLITILCDIACVRALRLREDFSTGTGDARHNAGILSMLPA